MSFWGWEEAKVWICEYNTKRQKAKGRWKSFISLVNNLLNQVVRLRYFFRGGGTAVLSYFDVFVRCLQTGHQTSFGT
jgi:hypothetical protein